MSRAPPVPDGCPLTRSQLAVIAAIADGASAKQISADTGQKVSTVRTHVHRALRTLNVESSVQAAILCWSRGWIHISRLHATRALPSEPDGDIRLKAAHHTYLQAFDLHLKSRTDEERIASRTIMDRALDPLCQGYGIATGDRRQGDLMELLVSAVRRRRPGPMS